MLRLVAIGLYTALMLTANPAAAGSGAETLREGDMKKLVLAAAPAAVPDIPVFDERDVEQSLSNWQGKWVVLNFWATWCAPCRKEMPSLDRLQAAMPELAVVPVATGRNSIEGIRKFYAEAGVQGLPVLRDPKSKLARQMGVLGLPVTVIVNPAGEEVARLIGDAEWDSDEAKAVLAALAAGQ